MLTDFIALAGRSNPHGVELVLARHDHVHSTIYITYRTARDTALSVPSASAVAPWPLSSLRPTTFCIAREVLHGGSNRRERGHRRYSSLPSIAADAADLERDDFLRISIPSIFLFESGSPRQLFGFVAMENRYHPASSAGAGIFRIML